MWHNLINTPHLLPWGEGAWSISEKSPSYLLQQARFPQACRSLLLVSLCLFLTPCIGFKAFLPEPPRNKGNYPSRMLCSWTRVSRALTPRCRHGDPAGPGYGPTSSRGFGRLIPPPAMFQEAPCSFISTYSSCILSRGLVIFPCEGCWFLFFFFCNLCAYYLLSLGFILFLANETSASLTKQKIKWINK